MKIKELRIGIYVYKANDMSVLEVTPNNLMAIQKGELFVDQIPITKEWLFKLGFQNSPIKKGNLYLKKEMIAIHLLEDHSIYIDNQRTNIAYVHQLQNLYYSIFQEDLVLKDAIKQQQAA